MNYRIELTRAAKADRTSCFDFINARNPEGAIAWLAAFEDAVEALLTEPHYGEAPESQHHDETIRQKMFKTRHGRTYRILYLVREKVIYLLHVRGPGQDTMPRNEIRLPEADDQ